MQKLRVTRATKAESLPAHPRDVRVATTMSPRLANLEIMSLRKLSARPAIRLENGRSRDLTTLASLKPVLHAMMA